jgi:tetratricopeptide (TPR) repeat protein
MLNSKSKIVSLSAQGSISSSKTQAVVIKYMRQSDSSLASELMDKALAFWKNGEYTDPDKALEYLNKVISPDSNYTLAYYSRGLAWGDKGNYDRAISDFNKAIELNPGYAKAYLTRGFVWATKGNYDQAVLDYNDYLKIKGNKDGIADQVRQKIRNLGYTPKY